MRPADQLFSSTPVDASPDWWGILGHVLTSPNVYDDNLEPANLVDTTQRIATALEHVAEAINRVAAAIEDAPQR